MNKLNKLICTLHNFKINNFDGITEYYREKITERINGCLDVQFQNVFEHGSFEIEPWISAIRSSDYKLAELIFEDIIHSINKNNLKFQLIIVKSYLIYTGKSIIRYVIKPVLNFEKTILINLLHKNRIIEKYIILELLN
jgi:hypothetical protein